MAIEIERRYLVNDDAWQPLVTQRFRIRQGYFARTALMRARIRLIDNDQAFITLKSQPGPEMRYEYEYPIPYGEAAEMVDRFSIEPLIDKVRHCLLWGGMTWSVDVFEGANRGLVLAEIELARVGETIDLPPWVGKEVTGDVRYGNSNPARFPYLAWEDKQPGVAP